MMVSSWFASSLLLGTLPAEAVSERQILDLVRDATAQQYQVNTKDVEVRWSGNRLAILAPNLPQDGKPKLGKVYNLQGTMPVPIEVWHQGNKTMIFPRLTIAVWEEVVVSRSAIARGAVLDESSLKLERRSRTSLPSQPYNVLAAVVGAKARREIPPGMPLTSSLLDLPPAVKGGSMVSVRLQSGSLLILTTGQALQDGRSGQVVRVLNPVSRRDYIARVAGPDLVEVTVEGEE
ncbi:MAG: flagellar basal body P-ring formation protein FlgA [Cyanobacteria bacterium NC_groundwater_1444_Ag_S-0.65um_54_12]|nr:flagellar basal body P-ring formation protein FlgA [Cyanobacteria bacterium NC_groundwater_1444_Ag_S-0.65um_54_12]